MCGPLEWFGCPVCAINRVRMAEMDTIHQAERKLYDILDHMTARRVVPEFVKAMKIAWIESVYAEE